MIRLLLCALFFTFCVKSVECQTKSIPMEEENWDVQGEKFNFEMKEGQKSLFLQRSSALAKNVKFENGIIEFDILFAESRKFVGFIWRVADNNFEELYLRPHQSGNPDANQYTPVFNGNSGWQLYHGEGHGQPFNYRFDEWMHVKIAFKDQDAEFYIDDMETPLFRAYELKKDSEAGLLGFRANGPEGGAYFANFKYTVTDDITFTAPPVEKPELGAEVISSWQISSMAFNAKDLEDIGNIGQLKKSVPKWTTLKAESTGTINISRIQARSREINTVFAKCIIQSESDQVKQLDFGYSDEVVVMCNDQLLYRGDNSFRSRDYRYLGTIGYFDSVYLPLKKGKNEITIAVREGFGGWGLRAKLKDLEGVKILYK